MSPRPVPQEEMERRDAYLAPLMAWLRASGLPIHTVMWMACMRAKAAGEPLNTSGRIWPTKIERGLCVIPPWLVEQCCNVVGLSVAELMGEEWVRRFGADGRGGAERAPVGRPHVKRVYQMSSRGHGAGHDVGDEREGHDDAA